MNLNDYFSDIIFRDGIWYTNDCASVSYPETGNDVLFEVEDQSFWFAHRNAIILNVLKNFVPTPLLFDIGGGNGCVCKHLVDNGFDCAIIEPHNGVINARKRGIRNIICSTTDNLKTGIEQMPAIGLFDVLEHIENDIQFLISLKKLLKPDGLVCFTVPAFGCLWSHEDIVAGHFRRYNISQIQKTFEKAGYEILYSSYFFSFLFAPILFFRSLPFKILRIQKGNLQNQKNDLSHKKGIIIKFLDYIWRCEKRIITSKRRIRFGSSIIGVAQKKQ